MEAHEHQCMRCQSTWSCNKMVLLANSNECAIQVKSLCDSCFSQVSLHTREAGHRVRNDI